MGTNIETHGFITRDLDELYAIKKRHEYPDRKH